MKTYLVSAVLAVFAFLAGALGQVTFTAVQPPPQGVGLGSYFQIAEMVVSQDSLIQYADIQFNTAFQDDREAFGTFHIFDGNRPVRSQDSTTAIAGRLSLNLFVSLTRGPKRYQIFFVVNGFRAVSRMELKMTFHYSTSSDAGILENIAVVNIPSVDLNFNQFNDVAVGADNTFTKVRIIPGRQDLASFIVSVNTSSEREDEKFTINRPSVRVYFNNGARLKHVKFWRLYSVDEFGTRQSISTTLGYTLIPRVDENGQPFVQIRFNRNLSVNTEGFPSTNFKLVVEGRVDPTFPSKGTLTPAWSHQDQVAYELTTNGTTRSSQRTVVQSTVQRKL